MKRYLLPVFIVVLIVALGFSVWTLTKPKAQERSGGAARSGGDKGPVTVQVETVQRRAMPLSLETFGTIESEHSVEVRPQVSGVLKDVLFQEGQHVEAGQLLFSVDPASFAAAVRQAQATLAKDSAQAKQARAQLARLSSLVKQEYITREEYDQARATADAAAATEAADRAQLEQAQIQLEYSRIRAPISGRTGSLTVRAGNLVGPNNTQPLVTVNQLKPVLLRFSIPQQNLDEVRRYHEAGSIKVEIFREDKTGPVLGTGQLVFIDNNINAQSGTIMLKARVANDNEALLPGQFVAVRMILTVESNAVVVPEAVVQTGQQGMYVYVVEGDKARIQPVVVARQDGNLIVIASGLQGGELVVTEHPRNFTPGTPVKINTGRDKTSSASPRP